MRRYRYHLLAGLGVLVALAVLVYWLWNPRGASPWDKSPAIQSGMTRTELHALLGGPQGDYRRSSGVGVSLADHEQQVGAEMWSSDGGMVYVWLDEDRVTRFHRIPSVPDQGFVRKVRSTFGF